MFLAKVKFSNFTNNEEMHLVVVQGEHFSDAACAIEEIYREDLISIENLTYISDDPCLILTNDTELMGRIIEDVREHC